MRMQEVPSWTSATHSLTRCSGCLTGRGQRVLQSSRSSGLFGSGPRVLQTSRSSGLTGRRPALADFQTRWRGAQHNAYPPVIAGGSDATTIHYSRKDKARA